MVSNSTIGVPVSQPDRPVTRITFSVATTQVSLGSANQTALLVFSGSAGQVVSLLFTGSTFGCCPTVALYDPDGAQMTGQQVNGSTWFIDRQTLPKTGFYTVELSGVSQAGSVSVNVYNVVDLSGTISIGGSAVNVTTNTPGQNAYLTFSGSAGQPIALNLTNSSYPCCNNAVTILNPDGSTLASTMLQGGGVILADLTLPATGGYTIFFDPNGANTGGVAMQLLSTPDVTGTLTIGGPAVTISTVPGQDATLTFSGSAGQPIALNLTNSTYPCCNNAVTIRNPDGSTLASTMLQGGGVILADLTLPATGSYTIFFDPNGGNAGSVTMQLLSTPDVTSTLSIGGPPVTVTTSTSGQDASLAFSGNAGQVTYLNVTNSTYPCCNNQISIRNPDNSILKSVTFPYGCCANTPSVVLPANGTYSVLFDPNGTNTGSATYQLPNESNISGSVNTTDTYAQAVMGDSPTAYWRLDDTTPPTAASAASAVYSGSPSASGITYGIAGALNGDSDTAVTLDGSTGEIDLPSITQGTTGVTLECWVNISGSTHGALIKIGGATSGYGIGVGNGNWDTSGTSLIGLYENVRWLNSSGNPTLSLNTWHHVALVIDNSGNPTLYLDGAPYSLSTGGPNAPSGSSAIGSDPGTSTRHIAASIDEATVYQAALTATQIHNHYLAGITNPTNYSSAGVTGGTTYNAVILNDMPTAYYRLDEGSNPPLVLDSARLVGDNGIYEGGVTLGVAGANSDDSAVTLDGSTGYVTTPMLVNNPGPLSLEVWFQTTATKGGRLAGFGDSQTGSSRNYDRMLYMTNGGQIIFGTYAGSAHTIQTTASYNDGNWHHAVGTWANSTLSLYVDGSLIGTTSGGVQNYAGYWRLGYDNLSGWPSAPSSYYFQGAIDEAAVYGYALSASQVANHYHASGR